MWGNFYTGYHIYEGSPRSTRPNKVNMQCKALFEMPTMSPNLRTFIRQSTNTILQIFFTISDVVTSFGRPLRCLSWAACRTSFKLCHQILFCCKRRIRLPQSRIQLDFDIGWTETIQMKVLYHITMTNFFHVQKFTESVYY